MKPLVIKKYAQPFMHKDSPKREEFADIIKNDVCPRIEVMLAEAPAYNSEWKTFAHEELEQLFQIQATTQDTVPSISSLEIP